MSTPKHVLAQIGANRRILWLGGLAVVLVVAMAAVFIYVAITGAYDRQYIGIAGEQRVLSQNIAKYALQAATGTESAFERLAQARDAFERNLKVLEEGDAERGLPPVPEAVSPALAKMRKEWNDYRANVDGVIKGKGAILEIREFISTINELMPQLLAVSDEVVTLLVEKGAGREQIYVAARQLMLTQRIENNVNKVIAGGEGAAMAADRFGRDAALFGRVLEGMIKGDPALNIKAVRDPEVIEKLREVSMLFTTVSHHVGAILERSPELFEVQEAAGTISAESDHLLETAGALVAALGEAAEARPVKVWYGYVLLVLAILALALVGWEFLQDARRRQRAAEEQNKRNQEAILRLLDEISNLAEGDLTVHATVTEDITGAIADSINYAIDALRSLVATINETSVQVSSAAQETQATAMHLAEASDHQAQQITAASAAINEMAVSIDQVSKNAQESTETAQKSVEVAHNGAETVRRTISGMESIREQIQETSKRIKRLGESSQEIGDIVELINDIADQTNILALNAAIQAAMAGEAGRGFAVVADEVQRLAERSANATKQIEALVKAIQTDTNEAVISMEQTTANVVSGAKLAEEAGEALTEIEDMSKHIAELIQSISDSVRQQASAAANISDTMNVIQEITTQTSAGTNEVASSIGNLAELATELRKSVAGFRLPE